MQKGSRREGSRREGNERSKDEDRRGGAASRGMEWRGCPGPGQTGAWFWESPDEKSVIIIITAKRTTIINHHWTRQRNANKIYIVPGADINIGVASRTRIVRDPGVARPAGCVIRSSCLVRIYIYVYIYIYIYVYIYIYMIEKYSAYSRAISIGIRRCVPAPHADDNPARQKKVEWDRRTRCGRRKTEKISSLPSFRVLASYPHLPSRKNLRPQIAPMNDGHYCGAFFSRHGWIFPSEIRDNWNIISVL